MKPGHEPPSIQGPTVALDEVVVGHPGSPRLGYAPRFVGKEGLGRAGA